MSAIRPNSPPGPKPKKGSKKAKKSKLQQRKDNVASTYWRDKADKEWSLRVREKNGGICVMCAKNIAGNAHHLIPRGNKVHRHNVKNGLPMCAWCHKFDEAHSPHQTAHGFLEWLEDYNPELAAWADLHRHDIGPSPDYRDAYRRLTGTDQ